jgi:ribonuclease Z
MFGLTVLGNNSAIPAFDRHPTAQALTFADQVYLIDCGEGTQTQIAKYKIRRSRINHIFISHLHGDHYFGLIGLISSFSLMGRTAPLHLYAPAELQQILQLQMDVASNILPYPLHFHAHPTGHQIILDDGKIEVFVFPTKHRIKCYGFLFKERKWPRQIIKEAVLKYNVPAVFYQRLQQGEDYVAKDGKTLVNSILTTANKPGKEYAYTADTIFDPSLCKYFEGADLLYHETTYMNDLEKKAAERFHSTTKQAGEIAKTAKVKRLIIGHFSSKYEMLDDLLDETRAVFKNSDLGIEGVTFII